MNTLIKGTIGEKLFELKCLENNWKCYKPIDNQSREDFIFCRDNITFERVQVKAVTPKEGVLTLETYKIQTNSKNKTFYKYTTNEINIFALIDLESKNVYLIENYNEIPNVISLRTSKPKNNQTKGIRFANEFLV